MRVKNESWNLKFWRLAHSDGIELTHATNVTHEHPRHMHEQYSIALIIQGTEITTCHGISQVAGAGSVLLFNPQQLHSATSIRIDCRIMEVSSKLLNQIAFDHRRRNFDDVYFHELMINDPVIFRALLKLHLKLEQELPLIQQQSEFISTIELLITGIQTTAGSFNRLEMSLCTLSAFEITCNLTMLKMYR